MYLIEVKKGEEVISKIESIAAQKELYNAAIVSLFGAFDSFCVSNMPKSDAKKDVLEKYYVPVEVIGSGEILDGKAHIHVVASSTGQVVMAGHLHWAEVKTWYIKAYLIPI